MRKQASLLPSSWIRFLPAAWNLLFYSAVVWVVGTSELPPVSNSVFFLRDQLFAGNREIFRAQDPGIFFSAFAPFLPRKGKVSFITDRAYIPRDPTNEQIQMAQGRMIPLILNVDPSEKIAVLFCSNRSIAEERARATGYKITQFITDGKGVAEKNP